MAAIVYFYFQIVRAVIMHEAALKAQAKKMNVSSLRANVSDFLAFSFGLFCKSNLIF